MQARARVCDLQLIRADREDHTAPGNRIAQCIEQTLDDIGDQPLQRTRDRIDEHARQRNHEDEVDQREPRDPDGRRALEQQQNTGHDERL